MQYEKRNFSKFHFILIIIVIAISPLFFGCGSTPIPVASQEEIDKFVPKATPNPGETLIYVFKEKTSLGAAYTVSVGYNNKLLAILSVGSYCYFRVPAGIVTVNMIQGGVHISSFKVDNRPNETVYLYKGVYERLKEVPMENAVALISKYKKKEHIPKYKENGGYQRALINPELVGLYLMKESNKVIEANEKHAVITFIRDQKNICLTIGIWNKDQFLGNLKCKSYFQIPVPPGKHQYFTNSGNWSVLEANIEAGKNYYVQAKADWKGGFTNQVLFRLLPVNALTQKSDLKKWMDKSVQVTLDQSMLNEQVMQRLNYPLPNIAKASEDIDSSKEEFRVLKNTDGHL